VFISNSPSQAMKQEMSADAAQAEIHRCVLLAVTQAMQRMQLQNPPSAPQVSVNAMAAVGVKLPGFCCGSKNVVLAGQGCLVAAMSPFWQQFLITG
jgi:hypothetical protein